jgi:hypothetical protein
MNCECSLNGLFHQFRTRYSSRKTSCRANAAVLVLNLMFTALRKAFSLGLQERIDPVKLWFQDTLPPAIVNWLDIGSAGGKLHETDY